MQMLNKLFKSDSKYYLELDESNSEVVQPAVKTAEKATTVVKEKVETAAKSEIVPEVPNTTAQDEQPAKDQAAKKDDIAASTVVEKNPQAASKSAVSSNEPPFWVAAMNNTSNSSSNDNDQPAEQTFARDNLMPTITTYRRRPGASLAKFKDMAKTAKTPRR